jgi:predicted alpha/beta hydrolase
MPSTASPPNVTFIQREIPVGDDRAIVARFFHPADRPTCAVLVVSAMGVPQHYYASFAGWLTAHGALVATFDYRGVGLSRPASLRGFDADILAWARLDCAAMIDALAAAAPGARLYWIGHSLGGQIIPFVPNHARMAKFITIAAGSGYWRESAASARLFAWWLWFVAAPLSMPLFGYFPGKRLRKIGDLPRGVMEQWRRWCLHPDYAAGAEGASARARYAAVRAPMVSLSFTDDELMSAWSIESLHGLYENAARTMKRIAPADVGVPGIGHFGFFRTMAERPLWRTYLLPELGG